jgi:hypothetical protein
MNYKNGKIYKIESHLGDKIYIGSTTKQYLSQRMVAHRNDYKKWKNNKGGCVRVYELFDEYGIDNCFITLIEMSPCSTRDELRAKEGFYIRSIACVNKNIAGRSVKEYTEENKEKRRQLFEDFHENNPNYSKEYYEANKEHYAELRNAYKEKHSESLNKKVDCPCGGKYISRHKSTHFKSLIHRHYLEQTSN